MNKEGKYSVIMLPGQDDSGKHILSVIAKRTYDIVPGECCVPSSKQIPLTPGDTYFDNGNPMSTSCEQESDYIPFKLATDVVFNGKAYAPENKPVLQLPVQIQINDLAQTILVIGNRTCTHRQFLNPVFSEPEPFTTMDIRFENAYGGIDTASHEAREFAYPRNPIGKGFALKGKKDCIEGLELPNLEDPEFLINPDMIVMDKMIYWEQYPTPQSFGWYGKSWFPRASFAGVMPADTVIYEKIREVSMGYVPRDHIESFKKLKMKIMDFRFFNGATPGMTLPYMKGDECIKLLNLDPEYPELRFQLPNEKPHMSIDIGDGVNDLDVVLHTFMIFKEQNKVCLTWRGAMPYGGPEQFQFFKDLNVSVE